MTEFELDLPTSATIAAGGVEAYVAAALVEAGLEGVRPRYGYVFQRLLVAPSTATELAADLGVTQQAMSKTLKELLALGFLEHAEDDSDRRRRPIRLSERGMEAVLVARQARADLAAQLGSVVGEDELARASGVLRSLLEVLGLMGPVANKAVPPPDGTFSE